MAKSKLVKANEKIAEEVVKGYKKIEDGVVEGYTRSASVRRGNRGAVKNGADRSRAGCFDLIEVKY